MNIDSLRIAIADSIHQVVSQGTYMNLKDIEGWYDARFQALLWFAGITITIVGIVIPILLYLQQTKGIRKTRKKVKQLLKDSKNANETISTLFTIQFGQALSSKNFSLAVILFRVKFLLLDHKKKDFKLELSTLYEHFDTMKTWDSIKEKLPTQRTDFEDEFEKKIGSIKNNILPHMGKKLDEILQFFQSEFEK